MVTSPNGFGVVLIGGWNATNGKDSEAFVELKSKNSKKWLILRQTLERPRRFHVAFNISKKTYENLISEKSNPRGIVETVRSNNRNPNFLELYNNADFGNLIDFGGENFNDFGDL